MLLFLSSFHAAFSDLLYFISTSNKSIFLCSSPVFKLFMDPLIWFCLYQSVPLSFQIFHFPIISLPLHHAVIISAAPLPLISIPFSALFINYLLIYPFFSLLPLHFLKIFFTVLSHVLQLRVHCKQWCDAIWSSSVKLYFHSSAVFCKLNSLFVVLLLHGEI